MSSRPPGPPKAPSKMVLHPPSMRAPSKIPTGPSLYRSRLKPNKVEGPGPPPVEFLNPQLHGSASEWPIYWALWRKLVDASDKVYKPPFLGGPSQEFIYQSWQLGGRSLAGGAVADFEIPPGRYGTTMLIRVQSYRFHLAQGPEIIFSDESQKERLSGDARVVDVFEEDFLRLTGSALVAYIADVLAGTDRINPITAGTVRRTKL